MNEESIITEGQWLKSNFPSFDIPGKIETHVKVDEWKKEILRMDHAQTSSTSLKLMNTVLDQLVNGVDSEVMFPGTAPTYSTNLFPDPKIDIPRIGDAIATEVKK